MLEVENLDSRIVEEKFSTFLVESLLAILDSSPSQAVVAVLVSLNLFSSLSVTSWPLVWGGASFQSSSISELVKMLCRTNTWEKENHFKNQRLLQNARGEVPICCIWINLNIEEIQKCEICGR